MKRIALLLSLVLIPLTGCQTLAERRQEDSLTRTLRSYENTVRWDRLASAWGFLTPEALQQGGPPPAELDNLRVISYDVIEAPVSPSEGVVFQRAMIRYVHQDRQVVLNLDDAQRWELDPSAQTWRRANPIPPFR
jgi:hypothetical protein